MRREELYLADIVEAADAIAGFLRGRARDEFLADDLLRSAVVQKLTIIGEAASRLSDDLRQRHPEIPWRRIVDFRNVLVHAYFRFDWPTIWTTATTDVPQLREQVAAILDTEFPASSNP
jgi:uncharacterized protein with HEPN domain